MTVYKERYDVLHAHTRLTAFFMRGLGRQSCAEIVTVHARFRITPLLRRLSYWGKTTIAVSEDLQDYLCTSYGLCGERVHVITNGIDVTHFTPAQTPAQSPHTVLFASRLDEDCALGAELLCKITPMLATRFEDLQVGIVGGGNAYARIQALAKDANALIGSPIITLYQHRMDIVPLLQSHRIFVGVSRAAMEAAACGCAVILCGNEGYLGILNDDTANAATLSNLCCRGERQANAALLAKDLSLLLSDKEICQQSVQQGRSYVLKAFNSERTCRETLSVYQKSIPRAPHIRLLIGGYFGCENAGDDMILQGFLEQLRQTSPHVAPIALSGRGKRDIRRFGIPCIYRYNPFHILWQLWHSDCFLLGGGSLLQDATSKRSLWYYTCLIRMARLWGKPIVLYASGIGPLCSRWARTICASSLSSACYLSVRDLQSFQMLEELGIDRSRLHLGADPALFLPLPTSTRTAFLLRKYGISASAPYLCFLPKGNTDPSLITLSVAALRVFCKRHGLLPILLSFDNRVDSQTAKRAAKQLRGIFLPLQTSQDLAAILSGATLTLSMRLHGIILSALVGTTAVGVTAKENDEKISAFCAETAQRCVKGSHLNAALLAEELENALTEQERIRPILADSVRELRKKAEKDLENIVSMVYNKGSK